MAHYAYLDENNVVICVIVGKDENELIDGLHPEIYYSQGTQYTVKRTSYNAKDNGFRKNYAGIGYFYDEQRDAFIPPKPFASWILDEETCQWQPPLPHPNDKHIYEWSEEDLNWRVIEIQE